MLLKSHMTIFNLRVSRLYFLCVKTDVLKIHKRMFTDPPIQTLAYADSFFIALLIEFLFVRNYDGKKSYGNHFSFYQMINYKNIHRKYLRINF
jgi:hypothetical protein